MQGIFLAKACHRIHKVSTMYEALDTSLYIVQAENNKNIEKRFEEEGFNNPMGFVDLNWKDGLGNQHKLGAKARFDESKSKNREGNRMTF